MGIVADLSHVLDRREGELQPLLSEARRELKDLEVRGAELRRVIERAESPSHIETVTLHEAMARILTQNEVPCRIARELTEDVNRSGLYKKRDGSPVDSAQVHSRARNYHEVFVKTKDGICMKHDYSYEELDKEGAREGVLVTVMDRETDESMTIAVQMSYTALATSPDIRLPMAALQKARDLISKGRFQNQSHIGVMLTSNGWIESSDG